MASYSLSKVELALFMNGSGYGSVARILSRAFPPTAQVSRVFLTIYTKLVHFYLGGFGLFQDFLLWTLSVAYLSAIDRESL